MLCSTVLKQEGLQAWQMSDGPMDQSDPPDHLAFAMLANPLASRLYCTAFCNYVISPSVKYLSDRKIACPMDPIDPSDICHACKPSCFKTVLHSALQLRHFTIGKIFVRPQDYLSGGSGRSIGPSDICHACKPSCFKTVLHSTLQLRHFTIGKIFVRP